jgi:hypothetical protein
MGWQIRQRIILGKDLSYTNEELKSKVRPVLGASKAMHPLTDYPNDENVYFQGSNDKIEITYRDSLSSSNMQYSVNKIKDIVETFNSNEEQQRADRKKKYPHENRMYMPIAPLTLAVIHKQIICAYIKVDLLEESNTSIEYLTDLLESGVKLAKKIYDERMVDELKRLEKIRKEYATT